MFHPLVSNFDLDRYEHPDAVADAFAPGSVGMSHRDQLARAWGHDYDYASDEMGAAASVYQLDATDLRLLAVAAQLDFAAAIAPRPMMLPYARPHVETRGRADDGTRFAYVRSDDRGFWDLIVATEAVAYEMLAEWREANEPIYCQSCGEPIDPDAGDCCDPIDDAPEPEPIRGGLLDELRQAERVADACEGLGR